MTINELLILEEELILEKAKGDYVVHGKNYEKDHRERLAVAIKHKCDAAGVSASMQEIRQYLVKNYRKWANGDKMPGWQKYAERSAKSLGFNPREYKNQKPGQSSGKSNYGEPEYNGRAYYFTVFFNRAVDYFRDKHSNKKAKENKK